MLFTTHLSSSAVQVPDTTDLEIAVTGLFLTIAVVVLLIAVNIATNKMPESLYVVMSVLFAIVLFMIGRGFGLDPSHLGLDQATVLPGIRRAGILIGIIAIVYIIGALFKPTRALYADDRSTKIPGREVIRRTLFDIPFGTVLLEEMAFRGVLYGMLLSQFGAMAAIIGTSALFGLWHVLPAIPMHGSHQTLASAVGTGRKGKAIAVVLTVLGTTGAGFGFAILRWWTDSIIPGIGLHWALNGLGVVAAWAIAKITHRRALQTTLEIQASEHVQAELRREHPRLD